jgi:hypothetical protein
LETNLKKIDLISQFYRGSFTADSDFYIIGGGQIGGKASGLAFIKNNIIKKINSSEHRSIKLTVPRLAVIGTDVFDEFMLRNNLGEFACSSADEDSIAWTFQKASLPAEIVGDLRDLATSAHNPIAIRSSSMLEDSLAEPFAGVYETKMISNSAPLADDRFKRMNEAIKFVYSSTFSNSAKSYFASIGKNVSEEKMAVIIQEVAGNKRNNRYYPIMSGVARSYNYYPTGKAEPGDGVVNLALGLGKTIVDGGLSWVYSPRYPKSPPPLADPKSLIKFTQKDFWAVNIGNIYEYSPTNEIEYLVKCELNDAESDGVLDSVASTYSAQSERLEIGITKPGPRVLDFSPLLKLNLFGYNRFIEELIKICEDSLGNPVEIEFALDYDAESDKLIFYLLQLRPMLVSREIIEISESDLSIEKSIIFSRNSFGNGVSNAIRDFVFVKPESFGLSATEEIAKQLDNINTSLLSENRQMLLIGFGRWGSSDKWLGIPVNWGQISAARAIVEIILPGMSIDLSQGSHFFHNLLAFKVPYFCIKSSEQNNINWGWLNKQEVIYETEFVKHIRTSGPVKIIVDGRTSTGIIKYGN